MARGLVPRAEAACYEGDPGGRREDQMTDQPLDRTELAALAGLDTPTICNALELAAPARRGSFFTTRPLVCAHPSLPPMVGYARTATIRATHPAEGNAAAQRERRLAYYAH